MLYKSREELAKDRLALHAEFAADIARTTRQDDLVLAVLKDNHAALAKSNASDVAFAKVEAARIEPEFLGDWSLYSARRFIECIKRDRDRTEALDRLAKRSERFLRRIEAV